MSLPYEMKYYNRPKPKDKDEPMKHTETKHELLDRELVMNAIRKKMDNEIDTYTAMIHLDGYQLIAFVSDAVSEFNEEAR